MIHPNSHVIILLRTVLARFFAEPVLSLRRAQNDILCDFVHSATARLTVGRQKTQKIKKIGSDKEM